MILQVLSDEAQNHTGTDFANAYILDPIEAIMSHYTSCVQTHTQWPIMVQVWKRGRQIQSQWLFHQASLPDNEVNHKMAGGIPSPFLGSAQGPEKKAVHIGTKYQWCTTDRRVGRSGNWTWQATRVGTTRKQPWMSKAESHNQEFSHCER